MSLKRFAEQVSEEIGHHGELTKVAIEEATRRLNPFHIQVKEMKEEDVIRILHHGSKCQDHQNEILTRETFAGLFDGDPLCQKAWNEREEVLTELHKIEASL